MNESATIGIEELNQVIKYNRIELSSNISDDVFLSGCVNIVIYIPALFYLPKMLYLLLLLLDGTKESTLLQSLDGKNSEQFLKLWTQFVGNDPKNVSPLIRRFCYPSIRLSV